MAICRTPWITQSQDIAPCGRCPECLINRKQLWTNRNILESYAHEKSCFVTLTYNDEHLPEGKTLIKKDLQLFIKRLRSKYEDKIRYYAVGEYGTAGERGINPHYHLLLYGIDEEHTQIITEAWKHGFTYVDDLNPQTIAYVVGYVEKKTKYNQDMYEELGLLPEFSTMSLKPTIGYTAIPKLVQLFTDHPDYLTEYGDVPYSIHHGSRALPLGQYIREKIREGLNLPHDLNIYYDEETGEIIEKKIWHGKENKKLQDKIEMQILQEDEGIDPKMPQAARLSIKRLYEYKHHQNKINFDSKQKFKQYKKTL